MTDQQTPPLAESRAERAVRAVDLVYEEAVSVLIDHARLAAEVGRLRGYLLEVAVEHDGKPCWCPENTRRYWQQNEHCNWCQEITALLKPAESPPLEAR